MEPELKLIISNEVNEPFFCANGLVRERTGPSCSKGEKRYPLDKSLSNESVLSKLLELCSG